MKKMLCGVHFADFDVMAYPYDMPITGFKVRNVNTLRFWRAQSRA